MILQRNLFLLQCHICLSGLCGSNYAHQGRVEGLHFSYFNGALHVNNTEWCHTFPHHGMSPVLFVGWRDCPFWGWPHPRAAAVTQFFPSCELYTVTTIHIQLHRCPPTRSKFTPRLLCTSRLPRSFFDTCTAFFLHSSQSWDTQECGTGFCSQRPISFNFHGKQQPATSPKHLRTRVRSCDLLILPCFIGEIAAHAPPVPALEENDALQCEELHHSGTCLPSSVHPKPRVSFMRNRMIGNPRPRHVCVPLGPYCRAFS